MKEIVVLSGKGGTGKTAVTSSFAALAGSAVLADADVDAANLALVLGAEEIANASFLGMPKPVRDEDLCDACGLCRDRCRFDAIDASMHIDPAACEGCGLCVHVCFRGALRMEPHEAGRVFRSRTPHGELVHARLEPGEENSGKLVTRVRQEAREAADATPVSWLLVDGPPGIGCSVIASLGGADLAVIVTEPGVAGMHDLERVLDLTAHFSVRAGVVVNRCDIAPEVAARIRRVCAERGVPVLGTIPFDRAVVDAIVAGRPPVLGADGPAARAIREVWEKVRALVADEEAVPTIR